MANQYRYLVWGGLALVATLLAACGPAPTMTLSPLPQATPTPPAQAPVLNPDLPPLVQEAQQDLSQRLGIAVEQIQVQEVKAVQWRDSSLGCPKSGANYLTVITPGYLIRLEAGGQTYEYHASENMVIYCENPQPPLEKEGGSE